MCKSVAVKNITFQKYCRAKVSTSLKSNPFPITLYDKLKNKNKNKQEF